MDKLRIRAYNVGFGDAILISVPDLTTEGKKKLRHILIDVGSVPGSVPKSEGGRGECFEPVIRNILEVLEGEPLDLYMMTHEHMDHVNGLYYAARILQPPVELPVRYAWLTASSSPDYYERFPKAREKRLEMEATFQSIERFAKASRSANEPIHPASNALMINNDPFSTKKCIEYLRGLASERTTYIYRGCDLVGTHPFQASTFDIWAPEPDTSDYYGRFHPMALGVTTSGESDSKLMLSHPKPPPGVATEDFYRLVEARRHGYFENLLAIDAAANDTSIVFCLNWHGWKLLLTGDAEFRSWKTMNKHEVLEPVHFLKVSHHGSRNGMPSPVLLDKILPDRQKMHQEVKALISTYPDVYSNVPDKTVIQNLVEREVEVHVIHEKSQPGGYIDIAFPAV